MTPDIEIHVIPTCPFCIRAIQWLDQNNLTYNRIDYTDFTKKHEFYKESKTSTMPQLYVNKKRIGGWSDLCVSDFKKLVESGSDITNY